MTAGDVGSLVLGFAAGFGSSTVFVLVLFIGFCVLLGFTKLTRTSGNTMVVKSLDETISHQPMAYLKPSDPRGTVDQLNSPELVEAAARK